MTNNEEKIKAFLNDEEKVKALASDEEFIGKVSGGTATPATYQKEFKKFGMDFQKVEAEKVKKVVEKIFEKSAEKLDNEFLGSVSGGDGSYRNALGFCVSGTIAGVSFLSALGCSVASCVYASKANKAGVAGDRTACGKYIKKSQNCGIAATSLVGASGVAAVIAGRMGRQMAWESGESYGNSYVTADVERKAYNLGFNAGLTSAEAMRNNNFE